MGQVICRGAFGLHALRQAGTCEGYIDSQAVEPYVTVLVPCPCAAWLLERKPPRKGLAPHFGGVQLSASAREYHSKIFILLMTLILAFTARPFPLTPCAQLGAGYEGH